MCSGRALLESSASPRRIRNALCCPIAMPVPAPTAFGAPLLVFVLGHRRLAPFRRPHATDHTVRPAGRRFSKTDSMNDIRKCLIGCLRRVIEQLQVNDSFLKVPYRTRPCVCVCGQCRSAVRRARIAHASAVVSASRGVPPTVQGHASHAPRCKDYKGVGPSRAISIRSPSTEKPIGNGIPSSSLAVCPQRCTRKLLPERRSW